ncbi:DoxX family membrane protein [Maribellus comscasis]|uniref:DoxX family membrane protein n=1 Tax=Maribellus comscasis TaxID=2681766 RepID=A0A6I6KAI5_9BACT|nr:DoxX family membrane protein [Maribellus comscasis]QGY47194.1 DoxX family membrane protein [Maribellus comscasis]
MKESIYSTKQLSALVAVRFLIGWHLLYEGVYKLYSPAWSSQGFLSESQWIMSGFAKWIISNQEILSVVDFLNTWGLIAIGLGLIFGLLTRIATFSGIVLLLMYYFSTPPLIGLEYSIPAEGNYLIINKTLIEAAALVVILVFPTGAIIGLDRFIFKKK